MSPDHKTPLKLSNIQNGEKSFKNQGALTHLNYT